MRDPYPFDTVPVSAMEDSEHEIVRAAKDYAKALMHLENMWREQRQIQKACTEADSLVEKNRAALLKLIEEASRNRS